VERASADSFLAQTEPLAHLAAAAATKARFRSAAGVPRDAETVGSRVRPAADIRVPQHATIVDSSWGDKHLFSGLLAPMR
jgi:hypothetical protein